MHSAVLSGVLEKKSEIFEKNMESQETLQIPIQLSQGCAVASIQIDLTSGVLKQFRHDLLRFIDERGATGVILDLSGVEILDLEDFEEIRMTMHMARLLGSETILCGLRPGVVAALMDLGAETDDILAAFNLDEAFQDMQEVIRTKRYAELDEAQIADENEQEGAGGSFAY